MINQDNTAARIHIYMCVYIYTHMHICIHTHSLSPTYSPTHGVAAQGLEHATLKKYRRQFRLDLPLQAQILKSPMYRDLT